MRIFQNILLWGDIDLSGYNAGFIFGGPLAGIFSTYLGWQSTFYITGCLSLLISLLWIHFVFDTPQDCKKVSPKELDLICRGTKQNVTNEDVPKVPPYLAMVKSIKVWTVVMKPSNFTFL